MRNTKRKKQQLLLEALYQLYKEDMYRFAYSILRDVTEAEDAVQNAFMKILNNGIDLDFEPDSVKAKSYCMITVRNAAFDILRVHKKQAEEPLDDDMEILEDALHNYLRKEQVEELHQKINMLKDCYRNTLILRHFQELSYEKIGEATGVSTGTARKRYQLARKKLEELICREEEYFEIKSNQVCSE